MCCVRDWLTLAEWPAVPMYFIKNCIEASIEKAGAGSPALLDLTDYNDFSAHATLEHEGFPSSYRVLAMPFAAGTWF